MTVCPNCQHEENQDAHKCCICGADLLPDNNIFDLHTATIDSDGHDILGGAPSGSASGNRKTVDTAISKVSITILDYDQTFELSGQNSFTLGRMANGQLILPDIDVSGFDAYDQGVSRQHAVIKLSEKEIEIADLGSSNGTRINGQRILAQVDYPLSDGDVVILGKLRIQINIKQ